MYYYLIVGLILVLAALVIYGGVAEFLRLIGMQDEAKPEELDIADPDHPAQSRWW